MHVSFAIAISVMLRSFLFLGRAWPRLGLVRKDGVLSGLCICIVESALRSD